MEMTPTQANILPVPQNDSWWTARRLATAIVGVTTAVTVFAACTPEGDSSDIISPAGHNTEHTAIPQQTRSTSHSLAPMASETTTHNLSASATGLTPTPSMAPSSASKSLTEPAIGGSTSQNKVSTDSLAVKKPAPGTYYMGAATGSGNRLYGCDEDDSLLRLDCVVRNASGRPGKKGRPYDHMALARWYLNGPNGCKDVKRLEPGGDIYNDALRAGRDVIVLSAKCGGGKGTNGWHTLAHGDGKTESDNNMRALAEAIDAMPKKAAKFVFVYNHEPNNDITKIDSAADYRAAARQVATDIREVERRNHVRRIDMGVILMSYLLPKHADEVSAFYPGNKAVDWIGFDGYLRNGKLTLNDLSQKIVNWVDNSCPPNGDCNLEERKKKPLFIGEIGAAGNGTRPSQQEIAKTLEAMQRQLAHPTAATKRLGAISYWNTSHNAITTKKAAQAFTGLVTDKIYAAK